MRESHHEGSVVYCDERKDHSEATTNRFNKWQTRIRKENAYCMCGPERVFTYSIDDFVIDAKRPKMKSLRPRGKSHRT